MKNNSAILESNKIKQSRNTNSQILRKFCRLIERNVNNFANIDLYQDPNRQCQGYFIKLDSVNGIKKVWKDNKIPSDKNFFIRFFITFFNQKTKLFYGNTYKSQLINIKFNETGHYELTGDPIYVYFLIENPQFNKTSSIPDKIEEKKSNQKSSVISQPSINQCILEVIFVETNKSNYILSQTCEGWSILEINDEPNISKSNTAHIYLGTPRSLLNKDPSIKNLNQISGASIIYNTSLYKELEKIKFLLPNNIIVGDKDIIPGLLFNFLSKKPILNDPIKLADFSDIYLKNVEIEVSPDLETRLIYYASIYRKQKYESTDDDAFNRITIKERKLRCGVHNSYTFVNSNGLENFVSLSRKENFLFYKGVHHIDNYFESENCAVVLELSYTLWVPGPRNQDNLQIIVGFCLIIVDKIGMENTFTSANLITGPGVTIYGDQLYESFDADDKVIRVNYILSKNKDTFEKTYKEKEIEEYKTQIELIKKSMTDEFSKMISQKDKHSEEIIKKKEKELEEMEIKLQESQRGLKAIYDKDDVFNSKSKAHNINNLNKNSIQEKNENFQSEKLETSNLQSSNKMAVDDNNNLKKENKPADYNYSTNSHKFAIDGHNLTTANKFAIDNQFNIADQNYNSEEIIKYDENNSNMKIDYKGSMDNEMNSKDLRYKSTMNEYSNEKTESNFKNYHNQVNIRPSTHKLNSNYDFKDDYKISTLDKINSDVIPQSKSVVTNNDSDNEDLKFYKIFFKKHLDEMKKEILKEVELNKETPEIKNKIIYEQSTKDISRRDKADLISKGLLSIENSEKSDTLLNYTFDKEINDDNKANSFILNFLAFKPNDDIKSYASIPDKIFFKFNFWDYEYFSTNVASVSKPSIDISFSTTPLILKREDALLTSKIEEKEMRVQIDFDPSTDPYIDYKDFINYLLKKQLFIQIYEAEKLFLFGYVKMPLRDLLRQGKPSVYLTKEYEIFDEKSHKKGSLQILIKSIGISSHKMFKYDPGLLKFIDSKDNLSSLVKKKKVKSKPLNMNALLKQNKEFLTKALVQANEQTSEFSKVNINMMLENSKDHRNFKLNVDSDLQKRLRAMKYVGNDRNDNKSITNKLLPQYKLEELTIKHEKDNEFYRTLNCAHSLKEIKKKEILEKVIQENHKNHLNISLVMGQPFYSNFIIHNNTENDELLHLIVSNTNTRNDNIDYNKEDGILSESVTIINSPDEWTFITEKHGMIKQNDYQSISPQNYLILKPNESIPVLIKIISYDLTASNSSYNIYAYKKNGQPLDVLYVTIVKVFPIIDHIFSYFFAENRLQTVKFPNIFKFDKLKVEKFLENYACTDLSINIQLDSLTNDFFFKIKSKDEGHKNEIFIFFYLDLYRNNLYATWKFEIHSMATIDIQAQIGTKVRQKLLLEPEKNAKSIQLYSSNREIVFMSENCSNGIVLVPNMSNEVQFIVYPKKNEDYEIFLNCIDISNRELIKSWLVRVKPENPQINHIHKIDCKVDSITNIKYEFSNFLNNWVIYNFESNNKELLQIIDTRLPFNANEKKYINISISPQNTIGRAEVLVFVSDVEDTYSETLLFQLNYK